MWGLNIPATRFGAWLVALIVAALAVAGGSPAQACTTCTSMYTDFTLMGEVVYQVERLHTYLMNSLAGAERAAQAGEFTQAALVPIGLGFSYGALHALGPGHGKLVVAGYFAGRTAPLRDAFRMAGEIAVLHVGSAFLIAVFAAILLGGVIDAAGPAFVAVKLFSYGLIALAGVAMIYRAAAVELVQHGIALPWPAGVPSAGCSCAHHGHSHDHAHHDDAPTGERRLLSLAVGAVPCTGALIAVLFALASGAWLLGLLAVAAISVGMGLTLAAVGIFAITTRDSISPGSQQTLNAVGAAGGILVLLVGATLFMGTAALL